MEFLQVLFTLYQKNKAVVEVTLPIGLDIFTKDLVKIPWPFTVQLSSKYPIAKVALL
jgi:hypothetical protein